MPPKPFFAGPGFDRADHLRFDPQAIADLRGSERAVEMVWDNGAPTADESGRLQWRAVEGEPAIFLGFRQGIAHFSALQDGQPPADARSHFALLSLLDMDEAPVFAAALSLTNWHRRHRFCANCGHATAPNRGGWSRECPSCGAEHYPRVDPVVIMLAEHDGRLLLGRQPHYPPGRYSALAGFVEPGETIEDAVARELNEEAGIDVADVRYLSSQPWPFPSTLMIGAHARSLGDELRIDRNELDDARWFGRDDVIAALRGDDDAAFQAPPPWAIARTLLEAWVDGLK